MHSVRRRSRMMANPYRNIVADRGIGRPQVLPLNPLGRLEILQEEALEQEALEQEALEQEAIWQVQEHARRNWERSEMVRLGNEHFHSHAGIIYVSDEHWAELYHASGPCHLYVALETMDKLNSPEVKSPGFLPDKGPPTPELSVVPPQFKIVNKVLFHDMARVCVAKGPRYNFHQNHLAPFRNIIPFEKLFREKLNEAEETFSEIAKEHPGHPAVLRQEPDWLPNSELYAFNVKDPMVEVKPPDEDDTVVWARLLRDGYRALVHLLDHELWGLVQDYRRIQDRTIKELPFLHVWHLFEPGQEIISNDGKIQTYRVLQVTGGRRILLQPPRLAPGMSRYIPARGKKWTMSDILIDCFHLDFSGHRFGPVAVKFTVKPYQGTRRISRLTAYPLTLAPDPYLSQMLADRGAKFELMIKTNQWKYKGFSLRKNKPFDNVEEIEGNVMVDFRHAYQSNEPLRKIDRPTFGGGVIDQPTEDDRAETLQEGVLNLTYDFDPAAFNEKWHQWSRRTPLLRERSPGKLVDGCHNLLPASVWGYVFLRRKWYPLDIDLLQPTDKMDSTTGDGFSKLVLPSGHRDIVRALVRTHTKAGINDNTSFDLQREFDVVKNKGKGLIILLHGAPGVGKTSTAECVAANAGKALFPITIGDITGESAAEVEQNLEKYFNLARRWNCVLLLDEADVFLSTRVDGNIAQNSLVSVFLRALEYYSGILILTTNRVGSFDEAIKSRVHCALYYPPLDKEQTIKVWRMNLKFLQDRNEAVEPGQKIQFDPKEIEDFARRHWKQGKRENRWNGRQIKNAFQTSVALADWDTLTYTNGKGNPDGTVLKREHFEKVAEASQHFDMYLERTRASDHQRARDGGLREDNITSRLSDCSESDEETESEAQIKKRKKSSKKSSAKKSKGAKEKGSKSKRQRKEESDEESTGESESEKST